MKKAWELSVLCGAEVSPHLIPEPPSKPPWSDTQKPLSKPRLTRNPPSPFRFPQVSILIFSHNGKCYEFSSGDLDGSIDRYHAVSLATPAKGSFFRTRLFASAQVGVRKAHPRSFSLSLFRDSSPGSCSSYRPTTPCSDVIVLGPDRTPPSSGIRSHGRERGERRRFRH